MSPSPEQHQLTITDLPSKAQLPESYTLKLTNLSAISVSGEEQEKYLQGQVTCDVSAQGDNSLLVGGHCDAKGKLLSVFRLVKKAENLLLLQPHSTIETSLTELKKFGVFAKVDIEQSGLSYLACIGESSAKQIKSQFGVLPDELSPVVHNDSATILYISGSIRRYLIVDSEENIDDYQTKLQLPQLNESVWELLEITEGFPLLTKDAVQQYVPQMVNLDAIGGISFTKGCYLGQETVARMQYLGKNKKVMTLITGQLDQTIEESSIEKQLGENWRSGGDVLSYYQADNNECYIQAVVASDLDLKTQFRFKQQPTSTLSMNALPYSTQ